MLKKIFKTSTTKSAVVTYRNENRAMGHDYSSFAESGYQTNPIVYRCVHLISRSVASAKFTVKIRNSMSEDYTLYNSDILELLTRPNYRQSLTSFIEEAVSTLLISGNCFISAIVDQEKIKELYVLRPDRMTVIPGSNSMPKGYVYEVGQHKKEYIVDQETGASEILQIKLFNPGSDWYGLSPISVAKGAITQHNAITKQNISFLNNGGRLTGALIYKDTGLDENAKQTLREDLKDIYEGTKNAGKIMLLEGDFEWKEMGLSPKDLDFISGKEMAVKEIALVFGVPSILVGATKEATFSNYKEARYNFWEETVLPILNMFAEEMSCWMSRLCSKDIRIEYDLDSIHALSKIRKAEWERITKASFLSVDEKRDELGFESKETKPSKDTSLLKLD